MAILILHTHIWSISLMVQLGAESLLLQPVVGVESSLKNPKSTQRFQS